MMEKIAIEIIESSISYSSAYFGMMDVGLSDSEATTYWNEYKGLCGGECQISEEDIRKTFE